MSRRILAWALVALALAALAAGRILDTKERRDRGPTDCSTVAATPIAGGGSLESAASLEER